MKYYYKEESNEAEDVIGNIWVIWYCNIWNKSFCRHIVNLAMQALSFDENVFILYHDIYIEKREIK